MFNTFGLRSVNTGTFNLKYHSNYMYPKPARNAVVTLLRAHNLCLNILGYIPRTSKFSGCARILSGIAISLVTLSIGERHATQGVIIQHWYDEALTTGIAQIARGAIEAFMPYGRVVNLSLDVICTIPNLISEISTASTCTECMQYINHAPYPDPDYPLLFSWIYLV